ncbi:MAG: hypothetical protein FWE21_05155 [Defluviitaleaceae bacterium]|nr:hypothetical protein [Defluviitaleaceae bacterium]
MRKNNAVIFKGGRKGIVILIDEGASFAEISAALRSKIRDARGFFSGAATSLSFKGKKLDDLEIITLLKIIDEETDLSLTFVEDLTGEIQAEIAPLPLPKAAADTYFHKHGLRNGQAIVQNGSVVVLGDVNAGAEVSATGNVVVFGALRGMVHAGSDGDESAFICALSLQPTQIMRIAGEKVFFPKEMLGGSKIAPGYAFIKDGQIHVTSMAE